MSEKKRRKKDGGEKNKDNQRMREANRSAEKKNVASSRQGNAESGQEKD